MDGCEILKYDIAIVTRWFKSVVPRLRLMIERDYGSHNTSAAVFKLGTLGSIWFDVLLEGDNKTKKTRVALTGVGTPKNVQGFCIKLDPTFDPTW